MAGNNGEFKRWITPLAAGVAAVALVVFFVLWWPLLGVVNECGDVLSGKRESKNEHLSAYNFSQDTVGNEIGASDIKGRAACV